ncbi:MAG TPA: hypothetical protein VJV77_00485 [Casimicrobiaceae bacterium]|nr:hypothetical protein [Casimicrobiaceae bacterium]
MRGSRIPWAVAAAVLVVISTPATAFNCYAIVDRGNEVIYQGALSPVDLSDDGAPARDALRARGQQLIAMDTDNCPAIDRINLATRGGPATVEEIVAGMRSATPYGTGAPAAGPDGSSGGIRLPQITVPRATGGGMSAGGPPSGMSIR